MNNKPEVGVSRNENPRNHLVIRGQGAVVDSSQEKRPTRKRGAAIIGNFKQLPTKNGE